MAGAERETDRKERLSIRGQFNNGVELVMNSFHAQD